MHYRAPVADLLFALEHQAQIGRIATAFPEYSTELAESILQESARFHEGVIAPLNREGDKYPSRLVDGKVVLPPGFAEGCAAYRGAGWIGLPFPAEWGGSGLPKALALAVSEMTHSACMAFGLQPMLSLAAVEALLAHGSPEQKSLYLPKLVSGEWAGTMNLTEPQAGSDLAGLKTRADPAGDGTYLVRGQKIYITWGDHEAAANIVHLVLARLPDAPEGTRGISLFLIPKYLPKPDGSPGERNDLRAISLEHKLGIHASPTCVMMFGEERGARAFMIGEPNKGLTYMFTMMNAARINVGVEGIAIAERAYQQALNFAGERRQGRAVGAASDEPSPILAHPDIRRTLMAMRARICAGRAICLLTAVAADEAILAVTSDARTRARHREDILTPIAKAWCTEVGVSVASDGIQIHGGMGYIEDTGAAQHLRDARIAPIYEGTNGIQAIDLAGRKLAMHDGAAFVELIADIKSTAVEAHLAGGSIANLGSELAHATDVLNEAGNWMRTQMVASPRSALAGATPFLKLAGDVVGAWLLIRGALAEAKGEGGPGEQFALARQFCRLDLKQGVALEEAIRAGEEGFEALFAPV